MKKIPIALLLTVLICASALMISILAVSHIKLQPGQITGEVQGQVRITVVTVCGDGACGYPTEDYNNCPADCTGYCGDVICDPTEGSATCCTDCGCPSGYTCTANVCVLTAAPAITVPPGGGGGISLKGPPKKSFIIKPDIIKATLISGQTIEKEFEIKNDGRTALNIILEIEGLKDNVDLSDTQIYLAPGRSKKVKTIIYALEAHSKDIYTGSIILKAEKFIKRILLIVEVHSGEVKFDAEIYLPIKFRKTYAGEVIEPQITIFDISKTGEADVHMYYEIKDSSSNIILSSDEILTVRNQLTFTRAFLLPAELEPGKYVLAFKAVYGNSVGTASEVFSIVEKRLMFSTEMLIYVAIVLSLIGVIVYAVYMKKELWRIKKSE